MSPRIAHHVHLMRAERHLRRMSGMHGVVRMGCAHVGHRCGVSESWMLLLRMRRVLRHGREMGEEFAQWRRLTHFPSIFSN